MNEVKDYEEKLGTDPSQLGDIIEDQTYAHDAVFGEITEDGPNYRNVRVSGVFLVHGADWYKLDGWER